MWWSVQYTDITDPIASELFIQIQCDVPTEMLGCLFMPIVHLQSYSQRSGPSEDLEFILQKISINISMSAAYMHYISNTHSSETVENKGPCL
jgi:hypothetical protein